MSVTPILLTPELTLSLDLMGTKLIEASAGTGKTYTISNLFCRFIIDGAALQSILLVTFTNAATDELKQRIRLRLKDILTLFKSINAVTNNDSNDGFLQQLKNDFIKRDDTNKTLILNRLILAMRSFDEAAIYTINGFCQRMLSDYSIHSGQHFELSLIHNDTELWQTALKDWWRTQSYSLNNNHFELFSHAVISLSKVTKNSQLLRSDTRPILIPPEHKTLEQLYQQWDACQHQLNDIKALWQQHKNEVFDFFNEHKIFKKRVIHAEDKIDENLHRLNEFLSSNNTSILVNEFKLICHSSVTKNTLIAHCDKHPFLEHNLFHQAEALLQRQNTVIEQFNASAILDAESYATKQTIQAKLKQQTITFNDQLIRLDTALTTSLGSLAKTIRAIFPIALIDEFQDTNDIQYSIFKQLYHQQKDISLIMIGDPKQAIYSFRGGDIFTYMKAKQNVGDQLYSLSSNWRSTPHLIQAINQLFLNRDDAFIYANDMPFDQVTSGSDNTPLLSRHKGTQSALSLWHLASDHSTKTAAININHHVANEICSLINEGEEGTALLGNSPVKASDIAILVRSHYEGKELATALKQRGINSINIGKDKVLQSDAAKGLLSLLTGIAQNNNKQAVRNMFASRLFMYSPIQINDKVNQPIIWNNWLTNVNELHELWLHDGFIAMFYVMLRQLNVSQALLARDDSERQITNLLHSVEIIQLAAKTHATPHALCDWLKQQINNPELSSNDEDELRLESDAKLVKIVTVHKSKGLEYPIVFVPFLWRCQPISQSQPYYQYHNCQQTNVFDFLFSEFDNRKQAFISAEKERLAEDMRLLYVALTRARSKCYLVTGQVSRSASNYSALAFLCHPAQSALDLDFKRADMASYAKKHDIELDINQIAQNSKNTIDYKVLAKEPDMVKSNIKNNPQQALKTSNFNGNVNFNWQISSFSRMTRDVHQVAHGGQMQHTNDDIFNFKRGGDAGTFLHHILELLDFSGDIKAQCQVLFNRFAPRYHLDSEQNEATVSTWMTEIVNTNLDAKGLKLSLLKPKQRLDELEFDFSLHTVNIAKLNKFLAKRSGQIGSMLSINNFKGMMTGFIDLVFEYQGKYYVADYKSNFLGTQMSDYTPSKLQQAVIDRRYDLQYLLYSLALHRYLNYRLPNYCYEEHFGGVYYLFLRAMRQKTGSQFGVFYNLPKQNEMQELDLELFKTAENS